jgi:hypothetical protein
MDLEGLVRALAAGNHGSITDQWIVNLVQKSARRGNPVSVLVATHSRVGHEVCLELGEVHVQGSVEAQARSDGADYLGDEAVQVLKVGTWNVQVAAADIVDGFVVHLSGVSWRSSPFSVAVKLARKVQSEFSIVLCVDSTALYGSTTAVDTEGAGYTENSNLDFLP